MAEKKFFGKNNKQDTKDNKIMGVQIPIILDKYITLYCIAHKCSKTSIIRPLLENWVEEMQVELPENRLIAEIAINGYAAIKPNRNRNFVGVIKAQKKELLRFGIDIKIVDKIIKEIINAKSKED